MEVLGELERFFASALYPNRGVLAVAGLVLLVVVAIIARRRRWDRVARRHPRASALLTAGALAVALPLAWYLGSPLVLSTTVDEPPPVSGRASPVPASSSAPPVPGSPSASLGTILSGTFSGADEFHFGRGRALLVEVEPGRYVVRLEDFAVRNGPDLYVYLSPSPDGYADGAVELARLKADTGNQNYDVPAGTDPRNAASVVIWCKQFAVLFATAPLGPPGP